MEILARKDTALNSFCGKKVVLIGEVTVGGRRRATCLVVVDIGKQPVCIGEMKVLTLLNRQKVCSCNFGPFDNGHIWLGLSDGWLLAFDYPSLRRTESIQAFKKADNCSV